MRERVEDLGRLSVLIDNLLGHPLLKKEKIPHVRNKDLLDWFRERVEEEQDDIIHSLGYSIDSINQALHEMREISRAEDALNQEDIGI